MNQASRVGSASSGQCVFCSSMLGLACQDATSRVEMGVEVRTRSALFRIPFKIKCAARHQICHLCVKNIRTSRSIVAACPICHNLDNRVDPIELDLDSLEEYVQECNMTIQKYETSELNKKNVSSVQKALRKFVMPCYECLTGEFAVKYCESCCTACCGSCAKSNHQANSHSLSDLKDVNLEVLKCNQHQAVNLSMFCLDDKKFICANCIINSDSNHKRHDYLEIMSTRSKDELVSCYQMKLVTLNKLVENKHRTLSSRINLSGYSRSSATYQKVQELEQTKVILQAILDEVEPVLSSQSYKLINLLSKERKSNLETTLSNYCAMIESIMNDSSKEAISNTAFNLNTSSFVDKRIEPKQSHPWMNCSTPNVALSPTGFLSQSVTPTPSPEFQVIPTTSKLKPTSISPPVNPIISTPEGALKIDRKNKKDDENFAQGKMYQVYKVCRFMSPTLFWLQTEEAHHQGLKSMMAALSDWCDNNEESKLGAADWDAFQSGDLLVYQEEKEWHRARVIERIRDQDKVEFKVNGLDNGQESVQLTEIETTRKIHPKYVNVPEMAIKCHLFNLKPADSTTTDLSDPSGYNWTYEVKEFMTRWLRPGKSVKVKIHSKITEHGSYGVDIISARSDYLINNFSSSINYISNIKEASLIKSMIAYKMAIFSDLKLKSKGSMFSNVLCQPKTCSFSALSLYIDENLLATIANFDDLDNIYLLKKHDDSSSLLDDMIAKIQRFYSPKTSDAFWVYNPELRMPVAALAKKHKGPPQWCRSQIIGITPNAACVLVEHVDYGTCEWIKYNELRYLLKEFYCHEVMTFKSRLFGIRYKSPESKTQATDYIFNWLKNEETSKDLRVLVKRVIHQPDEKLGIVNQAIYEIVLRCQVGSRLINLNVMLTKFGMAECTDMSIYDGEVDQSVPTVSQFDKIWANKMVETRLEKELKEIMTYPNKIIKGRPKDTVLCKVTNTSSPYEIWVQDIVDANETYDQFQTLLGTRYNQLIDRNVLKTRYSDEELSDEQTASENPSSDEVDSSVLSIEDSRKSKWRLDELCVLRKCISNTEIKYYRAKIVEVYKNNYYKVICLDDGNYEDSVCKSDLFELIDEFRCPEYKAKQCYLSGVKPTGTSNGEWSKAAKEFVVETLPDQYVLVRFERPKCQSPDNQNGYHIGNMSHEVTIFVEAENKIKSSSAANLVDEKYVRYSDIMNNCGLALLTEKQKTIEKIIVHNEKPELLFSSFSLVQPFQRFAYPIENFKLEKEFKVKDCYEAVVSHICALRPNKLPYSDSFYSGRSSRQLTSSSSSSIETYYESDDDKFINVYFHLARVLQPVAKLSQNITLLDEMSRDFEKCFQKSTTDCGYSVRFLQEVAKLQDRTNILPQACVCRLRDGRFYRCEILDVTNNYEIFKIRAVDYGFLEDVHSSRIFRPMEKYIKTPRLVRRGLLSLPNRVILEDFLSEQKRKYINRLVCLRVESMTEDDDKLTPVVKIYEPKELVMSPVPSIYFGNEIMNHDMGLAYNTIRHMSSYLHLLFFQVLIGWYQIDFEAQEVNVYLQFVFSDAELGQDTVGLDFVNQDKMNLISMHKEFKNISEQIMSLSARNSLRKLMSERVIRPGERCCALYSDQNIYRGLVKDVNYRQGTALIQYVDFGNEETVDFDKIFVLDDQFASLPEQVICVRLAGLKLANITNESSTEANRVAEILDSLLYEIPESTDKKLVAKFYVQNQNLSCDLYLDEPMDDDSNIIYSQLDQADRALFTVRN